MLNKLKSRTQAEKHRYNVWGGNPKGYAYDPKRCAETVAERGLGGLFYQCSKKPGHGPDGIFCPTHTPEAEARRAAKQQAARDAEQARWDAKDKREDDRREMREILVELSSWMAKNRELIASDEWLGQIAERMAQNETLMAAIAKEQR